MLRVLDLVEASPDGLVSFDDLHGALGYTRSTLYRHLKTLTDAGLIASIPERGFTLGPRIMELDRAMRDRDPLIRAARPVMAELASAFGGIALLCRRYRDRVLCIHQEQGEAGFRSRYARGLPRPMFQGAASRIILPYLPPAALARLHAAHRAEFAEAGLGGTLAEVREALRRMRALGWDCSHGQVTPGVTGIAAPLFEESRQVLGSLSVTLGRAAPPEEEVRRVAERVTFAAGVINRALIDPK